MKTLIIVAGLALALGGCMFDEPKKTPKPEQEYCAAFTDQATCEADAKCEWADNRCDDK